MYQEYFLNNYYSALSSDNVGLKFRGMQALLRTCLPCMPVLEAEERILQHAVPVSKQLFYDVSHKYGSVLLTGVFFSFNCLLEVLKFVDIPLELIGGNVFQAIECLHSTFEEGFLTQPDGIHDKLISFLEVMQSIFTFCEDSFFFFFKV